MPRPLSGHDIELLENGAAYFPALMTDIRHARRSVWIETYIFDPHGIGEELANVLVQASARGVSVFLVVDGYGSKHAIDWLKLTFADSGVKLAVFRPESSVAWLSRERLRRLHRKLALIDQRVAYVGGINIIDDYHDPNHGALEAPRFDFAVRVLGPIVQDVDSAMQKLNLQLKLQQSLRTLSSSDVTRADWVRAWRSAKASALRPRDRARSDATRSPDEPPDSGEPPDPRRATIRAALLLRDNFRNRRLIEDQYLLRIQRASVEIIIANAYFLPGRTFRKALAAAAQRGVKVRLLLQGKVEYPFQHYATVALYRQLLESGIEIYEYQKSFLHAKVAVIDDWATVGSSNIDPFSLLLAREANVSIDDPGFAQGLRTKLEVAIQEGSKPIELNEHRRLGLWSRFVHSLSFSLLRLLVLVTGQAGRVTSGASEIFCNASCSKPQAPH